MLGRWAPVRLIDFEFGEGKSRTYRTKGCWTDKPRGPWWQSRELQKPQGKAECVMSHIMLSNHQPGTSSKTHIRSHKSDKTSIVCISQQVSAALLVLKLLYSTKVKHSHITYIAISQANQGGYGGAPIAATLTFSENRGLLQVDKIVPFMLLCLLDLWNRLSKSLYEVLVQPYSTYAHKTLYKDFFLGGEGPSQRSVRQGGSP